MEVAVGMENRKSVQIKVKVKSKMNVEMICWNTE